MLFKCFKQFFFRRGKYCNFARITDILSFVKTRLTLYCPDAYFEYLIFISRQNQGEAQTKGGHSLTEASATRFIPKQYLHS